MSSKQVSYTVLTGCAFILVKASCEPNEEEQCYEPRYTFEYDRNDTLAVWTGLVLYWSCRVWPSKRGRRRRRQEMMRKSASSCPSACT